MGLFRKIRDFLTVRSYRKKHDKFIGNINDIRELLLNHQQNLSKVNSKIHLIYMGEKYFLKLMRMGLP